jgi:hypothetical protein
LFSFISNFQKARVNQKRKFPKLDKFPKFPKLSLKFVGRVKNLNHFSVCILIVNDKSLFRISSKSLASSSENLYKYQTSCVSSGESQ